MPRIDESMDRLEDAKFFRTLDFNSGYWQVRLVDVDKSKKAFTSYAGTNQWKRMPLGLFNALVTFERTLDIFVFDIRRKS